MLEPFDYIVKPLVNQMSSEEDKYFTIPTDRNVEDLRNIIEKRYPDILKINFTKIIKSFYEKNKIIFIVFFISNFCI